MRTLGTDIGDAVRHLPQAAVLTLDSVTWEEYERILEELEDRPGVRTTYDHGRLEIVTTSAAHERWKEFILLLVSALREESGIHLESYGGMTHKRQQDAKGTEPDTCLYVANAERMIGKDEIDLNADPPPDIVVEVDKAGQSLSKFPIYAAFGVPEIWRCDVQRNRIQIYELRESAYLEIPSSRFLPILSADVLVRFIQQSREQGQTAALTAFREWVTKTGN